jgi:hypothetical protein
MASTQMPPFSSLSGWKFWSLSKLDYFNLDRYLLPKFSFQESGLDKCVVSHIHYKYERVGDSGTNKF